MRTTIMLFITIICLVTSCYKVYDSKIDQAEKVLVVNGIITNKTDVFHIRLSWAEPFNSIGAAEPATEAAVYVTDDLENKYQFFEKEPGDYISDSLEFYGIPGRTYRLHILTSDGQEYKSDPQRLFPEVETDSVYAEFDNKVTLERSTGLKVNTHGANILADIKNKADTLPRFMMSLNLVNQYYYFEFIPGLNIHLDYYCWQTVNPNPDIKITGGEYYINSASLRKYSIGFVDDYSNFYALGYYERINEEDTSATAVQGLGYSFYENHGRILYLDQYTLNNETWLYYKSLDEQILSEGKLFDPIAAQLNGNIKCISDSERKAIGFFEASSVSRTRYKLDFRNLTNSKPSITKLPYILPPEPNGCRINRAGDKHSNIPSFWIYT
jgi:Domain of unknown function (DUF4249)